MSNNISSLLKSKRKELKLSVKNVVEELSKLDIDISDKTLYGWESGHRQPDADTFLTLCKIYNINTLNEVKEDVALSSHEKPYIYKYLELEFSRKERINASIEFEYQQQLNESSSSKKEQKKSSPAAKQTNEVVSFGEYKIPIMPKDACEEYSRELVPEIIELIYFMPPVSAGAGVPTGDITKTKIKVLKAENVDKADFVVSVRGDSMEPFYSDGDFLLIKAQNYLRYADIGVVMLNEEMFVKKMGEDSLISLNKYYDPIPLNDSIHINGRVLGVLDPELIQ